MDDTEALAVKAVEAIMQRVNDTHPRTLHRDVLIDEIRKVIVEAKRNPEPVNWPPAVEWPALVDVNYKFLDQQLSVDHITAAHEKARQKLPDLP